MFKLFQMQNKLNSLNFKQLWKPLFMGACKILIWQNHVFGVFALIGLIALMDTNIHSYYNLFFRNMLKNNKIVTIISCSAGIIFFYTGNTSNITSLLLLWDYHLTDTNQHDWTKKEIIPTIHGENIIILHRLNYLYIICIWFSNVLHVSLWFFHLVLAYLVRLFLPYLRQ